MIVHQSSYKKGPVLPGHEVIIGRGDYQQYAEVQRIEGDKIYLRRAGVKRVTAFTPEECGCKKV